MRIALVVLSIFAALWAWAAIRFSGGAAGLVVIPIAISLALLAFGWRGSGLVPSRGPHVGKVVGLWTGIEVAALVVTANVLEHSHRADLMMPLGAIIVGLHFFPLARGIPVRAYHATGAGLVAAGVGRAAAAGGRAAAGRWAERGDGPVGDGAALRPGVEESGGGTVGRVMRVLVVGLGDIARKAYLPVIGGVPGLELHLATRDRSVLDAVGDAYRIVHRHESVGEALDAALVRCGVGPCGDGGASGDRRAAAARGRSGAGRQAARRQLRRGGAAGRDFDDPPGGC